MNTATTQALSFEQLATELEGGSWLLTANNRLARYLEARYNQWQINRGHITWQTAKILPFHSWLEKLWLQQNATLEHQPAQLIHEWAARQLWARIISQSEHQLPLIHLSGLAKQSYEAWQLCQRWLLHSDELKNHGADMRWHTWGRLYEKHLSYYNLIDSAQLCRIIANNSSQLIDLEKSHFLIGFDELTPDILLLIENLGNGFVQNVSLEAQPSECVRVRFASAEQELSQVALWAANKLTANPQASLAILVPQLAQYRANIQTEFAQALQPSSLTQYTPWETLPFNLSQGTPLLDEPLIGLAFAIFDLIASPLPTLTLSAVLCSPYLAGEDRESSARSMLDKKFRHLNQRHLSHDLVLRFNRESESGRDTLSVWRERWHLFSQLCESAPLSAHGSDHARTLWSVLQCLGWSEGKTLNGREFQAKQQFIKLLEEYSRLNIDPEPHHLQQAINRLHQEAGSRIFQAETPDKPIQIMGLLEASELRFDHVWIMQMDDQQWPPAPAPHPFLPQSLQKKHSMPRTDHSREWHYAHTITERLLRMAPEVIFSYSAEGSDIPARPSPLIQPFPEQHWHSLQANQHDEETPLERFSDDYGDPITDIHRPVLGGAQLLNNQAECAFRAYAAHRLKAETLQEPQPGRSAWERGQLVHYALETIWAELLDSKALRALEDDALNTLVLNAIQRAQARLVAQRPEELTSTINEIERQQVQQMLLSWLELEKTREPFKVVALENSTELELANIKLSLRVDRIDESEQGQRFIIDYKTSNKNNLSSGWTQRPIRDLQLPLYALSQPHQLAALLIAKLTSTEQRFFGVSAIPDPVPSVKQYQGKSNQPADWQELVHYWQRSITELAQQAADGFAQVAPQTVQSCRLCPYPSLCRISVLAASTEAQDAG